MYCAYYYFIAVKYIKYNLPPSAADLVICKFTYLFPSPQLPLSRNPIYKSITGQKIWKLSMYVLSLRHNRRCASFRTNHIFTVKYFIICYEASTSLPQQVQRCRSTGWHEDGVRITFPPTFFNRRNAPATRGAS